MLFGRKPIEVHFEELELTIKMPLDIDCYCMAIRALWLNHDYYSDYAISYVMPKLPDEYENMYAIGIYRLQILSTIYILFIYLLYKYYRDTFIPVTWILFLRMYISDFLTYCQNEYDAKVKIREDQVEGRNLRLQEKKAILEKIENPPVQVPTKLDRKGKQKKPGVPGAKRPEPEPETEQLPYLPTPDEIILQREGIRFSNSRSMINMHIFWRRKIFQI